ncbi:hypothetical protein FIV42_11500 [Persicimonas caeni]|uniref:4-vinyl reductase 4VR domain-containing protein n=1 Tax=Persicimonas caeni TaxID=2292766 RepID=A0A4Y6PSY6_PERCE|nr:4-vinyl reductase [Persicimonas caeni]QDG51343.1 hypothetical protein FIV42_11500 [Persicimonas caeni]QED32564.1 hypothetical protein FRD00_11495 [Persicimonas caeni]
MSRVLSTPKQAPHGRTLVAGEPTLFHCNHYNYWLQKTLLLPTDLKMGEVIRDAAASVAHAWVSNAREELGFEDAAGALQFAADAFAQHGFGTIDFSEADADGGTVRTPTSHYGQCFRSIVDGDFAEPQTYFDQGYAAGAVAAAYGLDAGAFAARCEQCMALGAEEGVIALVRRDEPADSFNSPGEGKGSGQEPPPQSEHTNVDEAAVLEALAGLDFSGNEEGLIPRFGVMLTHHFANFYDRISFEFVRRMGDTGLLEYGEQLLVDAGYRCAFNTFGGIMTSAEWDAVVRPQCETREDWVHGMVAVVNALGWGVWRVHELSEDKLVVRIWDDYESRGWLGMYGEADRPICYLAQGGAAGIMNLVYTGGIADGPTLDEDYFKEIFESEDRYVAEQTKCMAQGDDFSEIVVTKEG